MRIRRQPWRPGLLIVVFCIFPLWESRGFMLGQVEPAEQTPLPNGEGADVTARLCGTCHTVDNFVALRRSVPDWKDSVDVMIAFGAAIDADESRVIVTYLGKVYGPDSPPAVDANRASKDDLSKLPGFNDVTAAKLLAHREQIGEFKSMKQLQKILGRERFERSKGYLLVRPKPGG